MSKIEEGMRSCDTCGRQTDAGEWPDWVNGSCEDCDPLILLGQVACDACGNIHEKDHMVIYSDILDHSSEKSYKFFCLPCIGEQ